MLFGLSSWGSLGAYRGVQYYNKEYSNKYKYYQERICKNYPKHEPPPTYYYLTCFGVSCWFFVVYATPVFLPITVINELYNLEEAIRGIKNEDNE